jgi:hypothetical protein
MLTEILHKSGVFFEVNMNHHESHFFSSFINNRIIMGGGDRWAKLPIMSVEEVLTFTDLAGKLIKNHWLADYLQWGYDGVSPWGIKDPRICVLLPLYLKIFPRAVVIHIRRMPEDVAASLSGKYKEGTGVLNDFHHWKTLTEAYTQRVLDHADDCFAYYELSYETFCKNPEPLARELFRFVDLPFTADTLQLLEEVSPDRIGSYQRMLETRRNPFKVKIRSWFSKFGW